jgi:KUP system potassium uptake protein
VLSAVEGLEVVSPAFKQYVIPLTLVILFGLFAVQKRGTGGIGKFFGPITLVWFMALAVLGVSHIVRTTRKSCCGHQPAPRAGLHVHQPGHHLHHPGRRGAVRHGRRGAVCRPGPFRQAADPPGLVHVVMPALTLNYFGQGALLLRNPDAVKNPFYLMAPDWALVPLVVLATLATVIASQALITGAFSVTKQVIQLGYLPRLNIEHTSVRDTGQIYIPLVNWGLFVAIVLAVVMFRSSSNLAAAYGIAVCTLDMLITTMLTFFVIRYGWKYPLALCMAPPAVLRRGPGVLRSNLLKLFDGGWFPLVIGGAIFMLMMTWKQGRAAAQRETARRRDRPQGLPGGGVRQPARAGGGHGRVPDRRTRHRAQRHAAQPQAQQGAARAQPVRHGAQPRGALDRHGQAPGHRVAGPQLLAGGGALRLQERPRPAQSAGADPRARLRAEPMTTSYFLSRDTVVPTIGSGMAQWREKLFAQMHHNASGAADFLNLPNNSVVELGSKIEI